VKRVYNERGPCPKCGCRVVLTKYDHVFDNIGRKCERCEYTWREAPLDAGDQPTSPEDEIERARRGG
jgi:hypothetical protein